MKPKLAILIPTIEGREHFFDNLMAELNRQKLEFPEEDIKIFPNKDAGFARGGKYIGEKRNESIQMAVEWGASHRSFVDDDDMVEQNYLKLNMPGVYGMYDCNSLVGIYSCNGVIDPNKHIFIHSLKYNVWSEDSQYYYRNPNHLNVVNLEKTKDILFPMSNEGEDGQWSEELFRRQVLKTEYEITEPFYKYLFRSKHLHGGI